MRNKLQHVIFIILTLTVIFVSGILSQSKSDYILKKNITEVLYSNKDYLIFTTNKTTYIFNKKDKDYEVLFDEKINDAQIVSENKILFSENNSRYISEYDLNLKITRNIVNVYNEERFIRDDSFKFVYEQERRMYNSVSKIETFNIKKFLLLNNILFSIYEMPYKMDDIINSYYFEISLLSQDKFTILEKYLEVSINVPFNIINLNKNNFYLADDIGSICFSKPIIEKDRILTNTFFCKDIVLKDAEEGRYNFPVSEITQTSKDVFAICMDYIEEGIFTLLEFPKKALVEIERLKNIGEIKYYSIPKEKESNYGIKTYKIKYDKLMSDNISSYTHEFDNEGNLYINTNKGIYYLDLKTKTITQNFIEIDLPIEKVYYKSEKNKEVNNFIVGKTEDGLIFGIYENIAGKAVIPSNKWQILVSDNSKIKDIKTVKMYEEKNKKKLAIEVKYQDKLEYYMNKGNDLEDLLWYRLGERKIK